MDDRRCDEESGPIHIYSCSSVLAILGFLALWISGLSLTGNKQDDGIWPTAIALIYASSALGLFAYWIMEIAGLLYLPCEEGCDRIGGYISIFLSTSFWFIAWGAGAKVVDADEITLRTVITGNAAIAGIWCFIACCCVHHAIETTLRDMKEKGEQARPKTAQELANLEWARDLASMRQQPAGTSPTPGSAAGTPSGSESTTLPHRRHIVSGSTEEGEEGQMAFQWSWLPTFVAFVLTLIYAFAMKEEKSWRTNENLGMACFSCVLSICSVLLLLVAEYQIHNGRTPQEKITEAARDAEIAAAARRAGIATAEVLAEIRWWTDETIRRYHLMEAATYYARKKVAAERAAERAATYSLPTRDGCCDIFAEPAERQHRRCHLLLTVAIAGLLTIVWAVLLFHAISEVPRYPGPSDDSDAAQNKRDLCSLYMGLYCGSFIFTWALLAYDVDYVGALWFFHTWPDEDEEVKLDTELGVAPDAVVVPTTQRLVPTTQRLNDLEELREKGLINPREYQEKKAEIMGADDAPDAVVVSTKRLNQLEELREKGLITDSKYLEKKAEIMKGS